MTLSRFHIRKADWNQDQAALTQMRRQVFVLEQGVPEELEWDGRDDTAIHLLARSTAGAVIGAARMLPNGHIGRMAVLQQWRCQGVGSALLLELLRLAEERAVDTPFLNAQVQAVEFYQRHGFIVEGEEYLDAGIAHRHMILARSEAKP